MKQLVLATGVVLLSFVILASMSDHAEAIPSFARKYETSCATCHTGFPKLNSFGEAFRQNGFQYPADDEQMVREEPVSMGAEAYKQVWPRAIWPGAIPGNIPLSFRALSGFTYDPDAKITSTFVPPTLQIMSGGTMGEEVSFFIGAHLFEEGELGSIDRFYLKLDNMFSSLLPEKALYLRAGQFIPELVPFASTHRSLTSTPYAFNTYDLSLGESFAAEHFHGSGPFGIENFQLGVEASGILAARTRYVVGVVNGSGTVVDDNNAKDGYFRLAHKVGGMDYTGNWPDGVEPYGGTGKNWVEKSVMVGVFGYKGARNNMEAVGQEDLELYRLGSDFSLHYRDINLYGGYIYGNDERVVEAAQRRQEYHLFFAEGNYMVYPWLIGVLRYEQAYPDGYSTIRRIVPNITALFRANIKGIVEVPLDPETGDPEEVLVGFDFGF